ncbi:MAG: tRNA (guanosine(46)-N7)-methyltransferase TrmB [Gammaproteobacteria bacterium]|nr:tRNA (guanosine(46)-N7)-methyltransferase TrmB [Gammaproteobacteria bacterium]
MSEFFQRPIRSFVLRQGRLTGGQKRALDKYWDQFGITCSKQPLDLDATFGRHAPRILDIGSGMGDTTAALAQRHPEKDYLAVEVHRPGVGSLIRLAREKGLGNIRIICHDVVEVLRYQLPAACLDEVYVFFPDPWPKKRHHKRRLVNPEFVRLLASRAKSHGRIFLSTDWRELADHMLEVCDREESLFNLAGRGCFAPRPRWRPYTKFERRGFRLRHQCWDLVYGLNR